MVEKLGERGLQCRTLFAQRAEIVCLPEWLIVPGEKRLHRLLRPLAGMEQSILGVGRRHFKATPNSSRS